MTLYTFCHTSFCRYTLTSCHMSDNGRLWPIALFDIGELLWNCSGGVHQQLEITDSVLGICNLQNVLRGFQTLSALLFSTTAGGTVHNLFLCIQSKLVRGMYIELGFAFSDLGFSDRFFGFLHGRRASTVGCCRKFWLCTPRVTVPCSLHTYCTRRKGEYESFEEVLLHWTRCTEHRTWSYHILLSKDCWKQCWAFAAEPNYLFEKTNQIIWLPVKCRRDKSARKGQARSSLLIRSYS